MSPFGYASSRTAQAVEVLLLVLLAHARQHWWATAKWKICIERLVVANYQYACT